MKFEVELVGTFFAENEQVAKELAFTMSELLERAFAHREANFFLAELDPLLDV